MEDKYNIKCTIVMMCRSTIYENIICDKEITECNGVSFAPMKFVYDPTAKIYYIIIKVSPKNEDKIGDNDIVIVDSSDWCNYYNDAAVKPYILESITRITNYTTSISEVKAEEIIFVKAADII